MLMPKNHSNMTCKKGAKILPTFNCIAQRWGSMSITHVFLATSHTKDMKREKCFCHIEITTFFLNWSFNTLDEKKSYFTL
jgi:hypothetical protein